MSWAIYQGALPIAWATNSADAGDIAEALSASYPHLQFYAREEEHHEHS